MGADTVAVRANHVAFGQFIFKYEFSAPRCELVGLIEFLCTLSVVEVHNVIGKTFAAIGAGAVFVVLEVLCKLFLAFIVPRKINGLVLPVMVPSISKSMLTTSIHILKL